MARRRNTRGNGRWNISFVSEWGPVLKSLGDTAQLANEWKPALSILADKIAAQAGKAISTGTGPDGYKWRPISKEHQRTKGTRAALVMSGKLKSAATNRNTAVKELSNNRLKYHVNIPYSRAHQFGSAPTSDFPGARVRNYLVWGNDLLDLTRLTLNEYAEQQLRKIWGVDYGR
ncbi:MAG: hypothetical protein CL524_01310 [Aequorivita sp.]|nr:hypothetical protein [Aequorivita sp.]